MERVLRTATTIGGGAVVAGVISEFFLYDGKSNSCEVLYNQTDLNYCCL